MVILSLSSLLLATKAIPGYVVGHAATEDGAPLSGVTIRVYGTTDAGRNAAFDTRTDASGNYKIRLPSGQYSVRDANWPTTYGGRMYRLPLYLIGENNDDFDSRKGGVADFILKIAGQTAKKNDPKEETQYFGGFLEIEARNSVEGSYATSGPDKKFSIQLTPVGKLMNGKVGKALTYTKPFSSKRGDRVVSNIPLGTYTAKVSLIDPDGTRHSLKVAAQEKGAFGDLQAGSTAKVTFGPRGGNSPLMGVGGTTGTNLIIVVSPADERGAGENGKPAEKPPVAGPKFKAGDRVEYKSYTGEWLPATVVSVDKRVNRVQWYTIRLEVGVDVERVEDDLRFAREVQ